MKSVALILSMVGGSILVIGVILAVGIARLQPEHPAGAAPHRHQIFPVHSRRLHRTTEHPGQNRSDRERNPQPADAPIVLSAEHAQIHGYQLHLDRSGSGQVVYWVDPQEYLEWPEGGRGAGTFTVELTYSCRTAGWRICSSSPAPIAFNPALSPPAAGMSTVQSRRQNPPDPATNHHHAEAEREPAVCPHEP